MAALYGAKTCAIQVATDLRSEVVGRRFVITGANSGLGFEASRVLAANGASVVMCSRSIKSGQAAVDKIKSAHPGADCTALALDLNSMDSVHRFAREFLALNQPLHVLINNAGIMASPAAKTADGYEEQFGVNHLGHFLLTKLLLPTLTASGTKAKPSRVINLASYGNFLFAPDEGINFADVEGKAARPYDAWVRYGQSKLANIIFARELQRRMDAAGAPVISVSLHPGLIAGTSLVRHFTLSVTLTMFWRLFMRGALYRGLSEPNKTIEQGAATTVFTAISPDVVPGGHYADCKIDDLVHKKGCDEELARMLWTKSEEYVLPSMKRQPVGVPVPV